MFADDTGAVAKPEQKGQSVTSAAETVGRRLRALEGETEAGRSVRPLGRRVGPGGLIIMKRREAVLSSGQAASDELTNPPNCHTEELVRCPQTFARVSFLWCFMLLVGVVGPSGGLSRLGFGRVRGVARRAGRGLGRWRCASAGRRAADGSTLCGWGAGSC